MNVLKGILLQMSVICSFVCIFTKILDWYNPYMDFSGHVWYIQTCLYVTVIVLALTTKYNVTFHGYDKLFVKVLKLKNFFCG